MNVVDVLPPVISMEDALAKADKVMTICSGVDWMSKINEEIDEVFPFVIHFLKNSKESEKNMFCADMADLIRNVENASRFSMELDKLRNVRRVEEDLENEIKRDVYPVWISGCWDDVDSILRKWIVWANTKIKEK